MVKLFRTELTATGRPVLLKGEVERGMLDKVDLMFQGVGGVDDRPADEYKDGYVLLTNYRLIWMAARPASLPADGVPCHLPLPAVSASEHKSGMLIKNARVKLLVRVDSASYPTADSRNVARVAPLKLVCKGPSPDTLHTQLTAALQRQAWAAAPPGLLQQLHPVPHLPAAAGGVVAGRVTARPPGERQQAAGAAGGGQLQPDWGMVQGLCAIGYPRLHAVNAVAATRNAGVQQAVEWLLDNEGSPAIDQQSQYLADGSSGSGSSGNMHPSSSSSSSLPAYAGGAQGGSSAGNGGGSFANPLMSGQQGSSGSGGSSWGMPGSGASGSSDWAGTFGGGSGTAGTAEAAPAYHKQPSMGGVGVSGILKREERRAAATETTMEQAFSDLRQLMSKAEEMVQLAQYFRERMAAKKEGMAAVAAAVPEGGCGGGGGEQLDAETALALADLGIVSPVTREMAGSLYHQELSRQLSDFLRAPMERSGGMMPLPDVYCLYNRARGTELISPDDLLQAINLFPQIRAPLALREFASGVKVVQSASFSDEAVCRRVAELVQPQRGPSSTLPADAHAAAALAAGGGIGRPGASSAAAMADADAALLATLGPAITRTEVSISLGVPVAIAGEHLRLAEARGVVCRDDGPEGLRFYRNFFADPGLTA